MNLAFAAAFGVATAAAAAGDWSNPLPFSYSEGQVEPRTELRDPCIIREGDRYYLVFTMYPFRNREEKRLAEPDQGGSPGIALYSSPDLKTWKFERDPAFPDWLGYWTGVAYADHPLGPWKKDPRGRLFRGGHLAVFDGPGGEKCFSYRGESGGAAQGRLSVEPVPEAGRCD